MRRGSGRFAATVAAGVVSAAALAGCVSPRNALGTTSNPCFRAVPVASTAVHHRGKLAGIRLVGTKELGRYPHILDLLTSRVGNRFRQVCVISFHGAFRLDAVQRPAGRGPTSGVGPVAIVVVSSPQNRLIATFVTEREPLPLRHEVLGTYPPDGPSSSRPLSAVPGAA